MSPILTFIIGAAMLMLLLVYVGTTNLRTKSFLGTILILIATGFSLITFKSEGIKRGIDLKGGSEFIVRLDPGKDNDGKVRPVTPFAVQQAIAILEKRLNPDGSKDLLLQPQGDDRILVQMPGISEDEMAKVRHTIEQVAHLEFRMVHKQSTAKLAEMESSGLPEPGWVKMKMKDKEDAKSDPFLLVKDVADLEGKYVTRAFAYQDPQQGWAISLQFDSKGGELFGKLTEQNVGERFAIVIDNEIFSAPVIKDAIFGGSALISGTFKEAEARSLASALENPLENPLKIESESMVSAAYGEAAIGQGIRAGLIGLGIIVIFMLAYYRMAGLIAVAGLVINLCLLFGAMALFQFTLTMPGIAGIALTIGMAVDANVLIYERLREEMRAGKTLAGALEAAFDKAFSAIFDSNITTLITAAILFGLGSGLVKGFAVTLTIGILSSLFGALIVTRVIFHWFVDNGYMTTLKASEIIPYKVFDVLAKARGFIIASLVLTVISFGIFAVKGKESLGIDFRGGAICRLQLAAGADVTEAEIGDALKGLTMKLKVDGKEQTAPIGSYYIQKKSSPNGPIVSIRSEFEAGPVIEGAVKAKIGADRLKGTDVERVGSIVGDELAKQSAIALVLALVAIFVYLALRFEFAFALGASLALFHDVLIVPGLCVLFGQQLSVIHVGALLAIAGYSINDTIIVFDRIREVIKSRSGSIREMMNEAISLTLSRTLLTSMTTLAPMVVLLFFGNPAMLEFALPIAIGVLLGTYSSIFIASPLVLWWSKRSGQSLRRAVLDSVQQNQVQTSEV